jgi:hypothetical protein
MLVELAPVGMALMVPTALVGMAIDEDGDGVGVGVAVAETTTGYSDGSAFFTSEGRAWYHAGGFPAAREDAISAAKAEDEASA